MTKHEEDNLPNGLFAENPLAVQRALGDEEHMHYTTRLVQDCVETPGPAQDALAAGVPPELLASYASLIVTHYRTKRNGFAHHGVGKAVIKTLTKPEES